MLKKSSVLFSAYFTFLLSTCLFAVITEANHPYIDWSVPHQKETALITYNYDGDTITTSHDIKIRLLGVNTPELEPYQQGANEAKQFTKQFCYDKEVDVVVMNAYSKDEYGRTLALIFVNDKCLNWELLRNNFAEPMVFPQATILKRAMWENGSGTASLSKKGVAPNTYYTSITYTLTPTLTAAGSLGGGTVEVTLPAGWTSPQNTSSTGKGYVKSYIYKYRTTSYKLTTSVSGQKVTITGMPDSRLAYGSGDKLKLAYYKYTTQPSEGTAKFTARTAGSGGTLRTISKQASVTVASSNTSSRGTGDDVDEVDTEVESEDGGVKQATLGQNYPNPFNPATTFNYFIPEGGRVSIKLYNVAGQEVDTVVDEDQVSGEHSVKYDSGDKLSRGVYYYRLTVNGKEIGTKRAVVLK